MNKSEVKPPNPSKKPKKQGLLRVEAIVPFSLVVAAICLYFTLFFDHHLRRGISWVGGLVTGAEVNVGSVHTSFLRASFVLKDLQVTDYDQPAKNKIQLAEIRFQLLWDALLRAKFVIKEASILGIQIDSPRKNPGRILRRPAPPRDPSKPGAAEKLAHKALAVTESQFKDNALGDLAGLLGGSDPTAKLNELQSQLTSVAKINELERELGEKQKLWEERLKTLPNDKDLDAFKQRLQAVELPKDLKNPQQIKEAAEKIQSIIKEADGKVKIISEIASSLGSELNRFQSSIKEIDELAKKDLQNVQKRVQLPSLDPKAIAKSLFGKWLHQKLGSYAKYVTLAQEYMPHSSGKKDDGAITPPGRKRGKSYQFGRPKAYPLFWLQHSAISSVANPAIPTSGNLRGDLTDVASDPVIIGRPAILNLQGDFPQLRILGIQIKLTLDHTQTPATDSLAASVASYPIEGRTLAESDALKIGFARAVGQSTFMASVRERILQMEARNLFTQVNYEISASNSTAETALKDILLQIPQVTMNATAKGPMDDLNIDINSNLGEEIRKGVERLIQAKINEARAKIQAFIDQNIKGKREELQGQFNKIQSQIKGLLEAKKGKVDETKKLADNRSKEAQQSGKKQLEDAGKKGLEDLKKKFGF